MKTFFILTFIISNFFLAAATNETIEIYDIISSLEYKLSYPLTYKDVDQVNGDTTCVVFSDGTEFLTTPRNQRFWIRDLKTGKYWEKGDNNFDLNFGIYSASNRLISHGKTYIIIIYKGLITVYDWNDSMALATINKILTELKYSPLAKLSILENVLNAKVSSHVFKNPLAQERIQ